MESFIYKRKNIKLGKGFYNRLESGKKRRFPNSNARVSKLKDFLSLGFFILGFLLILIRLFYLTVLKGAYYQNLAQNNHIREERIKPARGVIYDRNGRVLARNRPIYIIRTENRKQKTENRKQKTENRELLKVISREEALRLESQGQNVEIELAREYPEGKATAHIVGYMGEISEEELSNYKDRASLPSSRITCSKLLDLHADRFLTNNICYQSGDWIGKTGAEQAFEKTLRGVPGKRLIEIDSLGKEIRELARVEPKKGKNIYLSIDLKLQKKAEEEMIGKKGAVIASNPATGEILAFYSAPSFDPNLFIEEDAFNSLKNILNNQEQPLFNRVIGGLYPPGSTFKIITAVAGLESGAINQQTKIEDTGVISIGPYKYSNWYFTQYGKKEEDVDIVKALQRSNDIFFYKTGERVGIERLEEWAKRFKLNTKLGIEIAGEKKGIIRKKRDWFLGDTYHLAIGQGDLLTTPLDVNAWSSIIANNGKLCRPTVLKNSRSLENLRCQDLQIKKETISLITEGMKKACEPGGTGWPLFNFQTSIACKTGTAEYGDEQKKTHAWFTAFGPISKPEIAVTVLVEGGGEGSSIAGPIVKNILNIWFLK